MQHSSALAPVVCAVVGCGDVSAKYLATLLAAPIIEIGACCDVVSANAERAAARCPRATPASLADILADPAVELLINLTPPQQHAEITRRALQSGKSVYSEKPLAITEAQRAELIAMAHARGLFLGGAPDTMLGPAAQAVRRAIDGGLIGRPFAATANLLTPGHERSAHAPQVFYRGGAGPLLDMGVYYVAMLVGLLGPVRRVTGAHSLPAPQRVIDTGPDSGATFTADVPTHVAALMEFQAGQIGTLTASFDVWATDVPHLEIYGTEGTISVPDPNFYTGEVRLRTARAADWRGLRYAASAPRGRGIGVIDMAHAMRGLTPQRLNAALVGHVLEALLAVTAEPAGPAELTSSCERPPPLNSTSRSVRCWWCSRCAGAQVRRNRRPAAGGLKHWK
jgi:predicted dehydrogenase